MARTTPEEVRAINGSTLDDASIQPFIDTATVIIDSVVACANTDEETLKQAETWLTCHLMAISSTGTGAGRGTAKAQESFDMYSITWAVGNSTGGGVLSTNYGSTANMLVNGCLFEKNKQKCLIAFGGGANVS